jgi:tetratricopeptide (TPR) repeat protein
MENATAALARAGQLEPDNAVVHYFVGILRLQQAYVADEWNDAEGPQATVLVSHSPHPVVPNTQSMYRMQAVLELEDAVRLAPQVHLFRSLVPEEWPTAAVMPPAVHDVLLAARADNFAAKAHNVLGDLYLGRGALEQAEQHMDAAVQGGLSVVYGYGDLAEAYEKVGRHSDAMRVYLKAAQGEPGKVAPLKKAWENLRDSML